MDKKKAIVCTILFAIVIITIVIGSYFIKKDSGSCLGYHISACISGLWIADKIEKFYKWLIK